MFDCVMVRLGESNKPNKRIKKVRTLNFSTRIAVTGVTCLLQTNGLLDELINLRLILSVLIMSYIEYNVKSDVLCFGN